MMLRQLTASLLAGAALLAPMAFAHDTGTGQEKVIPLTKQALPDIPGKNVIMATVNYEPGQASDPHIHPGSVFAYVLEGEVISQLEGQAPVTYKQGDYWYETPKIGHIVSRNASATKPAKLLVWLLVGDGEQLKLPLSK
ncbi:cupin domain-containing protein [Undibacterium sp. TJN25]|uniref:cupin domain-containing protein n=1 Tax=Undibacterium sp. TJN25 TaxID=3413056 RepID=UPI003BEF6285